MLTVLLYTNPFGGGLPPRLESRLIFYFKIYYSLFVILITTYTAMN